MASGSSDHNINIYNSQNYNYQKSLRNDGWVKCIVLFKKNRNKLISACDAGNIKFWAISNGECLYTI